jgi:maltokinase
MTFEDTLARWLPAQRWYSGTAAIRDLTITSQTTLVEGDPELRHLIVTVPANGTTARYQIVAGLRSEVPASLRRAVIGPVSPGVTAYDALHDPALAGMLLRAIARQETVGPLRFGQEPGAGISDGLDSFVLSGEQSNTSIVFGKTAILKVLRRIFPGEHPDLEVTRALAELGCTHVAEPLGWIETRDGGDLVLLAIMSRYLAGSCEGWALANTSLRALYQPGGAAEGASPGEIGPDFAGEAFALGMATAEVHADLAAAFGAEQADQAASAELAFQMAGRLGTAAGEVPALSRHAAAIQDAYAALAELREPVAVQRIHGDYHLGQVLRTKGATDPVWVVLDFEGEPLVPIGERRARGSAMRDVAGMLRSFDYAARHQLLDRADAGDLRSRADEWVERCQAAFCDGYAAAGGPDPRAHPVLMRALMFDKAVYEVMYEARHRPSWLPIPLGAIAQAI